MNDLIEFDPIDRINILCQERGWTYYRLAQKSGIPYSTLSTMLKKTNSPSLPSIMRICEGFEISLSDFFQCNYQPSLSAEEHSCLSLWNELDADGHALTLAYMQGIRDAKKKP